MATAVKKSVNNYGNEYPGYITTKLSDYDFLTSVLINWAEYSPEEATMKMVDYKVRRKIGEWALRIGVKIDDSVFSHNYVYLIKIGVGKWVIPNMDFEELEEFAEACEENLDEPESAEVFLINFDLNFKRDKFVMIGFSFFVALATIVFLYTGPGIKELVYFACGGSVFVILAIFSYLYFVYRK